MFVTAQTATGIKVLSPHPGSLGFIFALFKNVACTVENPTLQIVSFAIELVAVPRPVLHRFLYRLAALEPASRVGVPAASPSA